VPERSALPWNRNQSEGADKKHPRDWFSKLPSTRKGESVDRIECRLDVSMPAFGVVPCYTVLNSIGAAFSSSNGPTIHADSIRCPPLLDCFAACLLLLDLGCYGSATLPASVRASAE
jgi:hypothetical protein